MRQIRCSYCSVSACGRSGAPLLLRTEVQNLVWEFVPSGQNWALGLGKDNCTMYARSAPFGRLTWRWLDTDQLAMGSCPGVWVLARGTHMCPFASRVAGHIFQRQCEPVVRSRRDTTHGEQPTTRELFTHHHGASSVSGYVGRGVGVCICLMMSGQLTTRYRGFCVEVCTCENLRCV